AIGVVVLAIGVSCAGANKPAPQPKPAEVQKPASEGSNSSEAPPKVGDVVFGQWTDGNWYLGKIAALNADGTYAVNYNDGDVSPSLSASQVRRPPTIVVPKVEPATPDTPAGRTLRAWLDVFNSGDEPRTRAFAEQHKGPHDPGFHKATGGFYLLSIEKSAPLAITFVVKEKANPTTAIGWLRLKSADPVEIELILVQAIPPGKTAADMDPKLDVATRTRILDAIAAKLNELYVFPDVAKKMEQALREHQKQGAYDAVPESRAFAELLTEQLRAVSRDKHLRVNFMPMVLPADEPKEPSAADKERMRAQLERINCGFDKVERIDGNIGYVKFNMFAEAELCGPKATEMLGSLGDVDALIFDLTDNGGGHPDMVAFVSSYLFAKRTHLNDIYDRKENKTTQYWTKPEVGGKKFATQPVYVLTSNRTFSGAEEFSYNLKNLKRATIVGETTGGGAHPTMGVRVDDHFMIGVPFARAINPITKKNWEGTGVEPDVKVPAAQALDTAKKLAAEKIEQLKKQKKPGKK
ncbi:MAG TPA: S41 family peptidase, partial [Kofleriaceae bacterium]